MGSFTKVYSRKFHPEESLVLTWDAGYKNVEVYDGDRLVYKSDTPAVFMKGVTIQDEELGEIKISFTTTRPLQLELKVRGKSYKPNKDGKQSVDLSGVISIFWIMTAFTAIVVIYLVLMYANYFIPRDSVLIIASIIGVIMLIYLATAILMLRKLYWAYFIGTGYMTVSTLYYLWISIVIPDMYALMFMSIIRLTMLAYLYISMRKVLYAMRFGTEKSRSESILDEKF